MTERAVIPIDCDQRQQVLDVTRSFIVQAPAGSGKTELLIQRILALLAISANPEEILAITFTRKAAAEMHNRLLEALENARSDLPPTHEHAARTWSLARAVLSRDLERDWHLRDNPLRLQVMTIDSFCAALVRRMPYLARFGEVPAIAEDPLDLYRTAAERLLARLEKGGEGCAAIERLLRHLDNQLPLLRNLLVAMLARRDQWLRHLDPDNLANARPALESALQQQIAHSLAALQACLDDDLRDELTTLGAWAAGNLSTTGGVNPLAALEECSSPPAASVADSPKWLALCHLVLTGDDEVRKAADIRLGFPAGKDPVCQEMKTRIMAAYGKLNACPVIVERFRELRLLPAAVYDDDQWEVLAALIELLLLADRELRESFRAEGTVDFAEIACGALTALGDDMAPGDLLLHLDSRLRHILVDEFQDTARGQYELLSRLIAGWEHGDGRTLFVVGDPMQSIYRFREAEVGLYLRARARGIDALRLDPLILQTNFRSQAGLVDWFNATFAQLFPETEDEIHGAVPYAAATAASPVASGPAVTLTCFAGRDDAAEALRVIDLIRQARATDPSGTVAVLVRSRSHLAALVPALKTAGFSWQAQEIDLLSSRPAVRDLLALTRAVLHPADRIAWLSVLRAPWCGLYLDDLLALCGQHPQATIWECLTTRLDQPLLFPALSTDAETRLAVVVRKLERVIAAKGRVPLRRLIETAWLSLNGPAGLTPGDLADTEVFFVLLEELDAGGDLVRLEALEERLAKLFAAPDPLAGPDLQLMTIHKAKGLEFDTVILPGLGRSVRSPERPLLLWQELLDPSNRQAGLLLAPIPASDSDSDEPIYRAIAHLHAQKDQLETLRLLYVAATRARRRLHLLGHAARNKNGELAPASGSLLKAAWPALAVAAEENTVEAGERMMAATVPGVVLRRLPAGWSVPSPATVPGLAMPVTRRASDAGHRQGTGLSLSLRAETGRIVGTVVHQCLEQIARDGAASWSASKLEALRSSLADTLINSGVPRMYVVSCVERTVTALVNTLGSIRGRWLLSAHRDAASELELTGIIDGVPVHAVIDRTFVDENGVRWVIDYKTSEPGEGEGLEIFLDRERERYRPQLNDYRKLIALQEPQARVGTALYFPLLDAWCEVE